MNNISSQLTTLQENLESAAFLVSRGDSEKEAHSKIVQSLVLLSQIELKVRDLLEAIDFDGEDTPEERINTPSQKLRKKVTSPTYSGDYLTVAEIEKVKRRVPRWFNNPSQNNSTILNRFLELREKNHQITVTMLRKKCPSMNDFDGNYNQMKNFGEKNHAKVFEESDGIISLWEPVKDFILGLYKERKV